MPVLSLSITPDLLTGTLMQRSWQTRKVLACEQLQPLPDKSLSENLAFLLDKLNCHGKCPVYCLLSTDYFSCRPVHLPFTGKKKIREALPFTVEPMLPNAADSYIFRGSPYRKTTTSTEVLALCLEKDIYTDLAAFLQSFQLDPQIITSHSLPLLAALQQQRKDIHTGILLVQYAGAATILHFADNHLLQLRYIPAQEALRPEIMGQLLQQTLAAQPDFPVQHLFSMGTDIPGFEDIPKTTIIPGDLHPGFTGNIHALDCTLLLSTPSATINDLNFRPITGGSQWLTRYNDELKIAAGYCLLILLLAGLLQWNRIDTLQRHRDLLDNRITSLFHATLPETSRMVDPVQQFTAAIKRERGEKKSFRNSTKTITAIINTLTGALPESLPVQITRFVINEDETALLGGKTDTFNTLDALKGLLLKSSLFDSIAVTTADFEESDNTVNFELTLQ